jgi:integrase
MKAWLFQDHRQKQKLGDKAPWSVGWVDPEGKRKSKRLGSHSAAEKHARRIEGQLAAGTYEDDRRKKWADFRTEYETKGRPGAAVGSLAITSKALNAFERIVNPVRLSAITSKTIATFAAARSVEPIREDGPIISPATVNLELRQLRAVVRKAHKWGYLPKLPEFEFLREPGKLPTYVSPEHFAKLYKAADAARWPGDGPYAVAEWWRALFVMAYMTGWRIGSIMALQWQDVDLDKGTALSRAADNKGKRDQFVPLHPIVVEHLRKLVCFSAVVFGWDHPRRALFLEFHAIQKAAKVKPEGTKPRYGFHDFRRAFATMNAATLTPDALQALMQHKDYQTTQRYINMARQLNPAVQNLFVPDLAGVAG